MQPTTVECEISSDGQHHVPFRQHAVDDPVDDFHQPRGFDSNHDVHRIGPTAAVPGEDGGHVFVADRADRGVFIDDVKIRTFYVNDRTEWIFQFRDKRHFQRTFSKRI